MCIVNREDKRPLWWNIRKVQFKHCHAVGCCRIYYGHWLFATSYVRLFYILSHVGLYITSRFSYVNSDIKVIYTLWCFQCLSSKISKCLTFFAEITFSGKLFHVSIILLVKAFFLIFSLLLLFVNFLLCPLVWMFN